MRFDPIRASCGFRTDGARGPRARMVVLASAARTAPGLIVRRGNRACGVVAHMAASCIPIH